jgi:AraC-like DNA-binding protein
MSAGADHGSERHLHPYRWTVRDARRQGATDPARCLQAPRASRVRALRIHRELETSSAPRRSGSPTGSIGRTWTARGEALDHFLLDRAARGPQPSPEVGRAWQLLVNSIGATPIKAIARHVGWSHKHLITKFKQQIGVTPHVAARSCLSKVWRHLDDERSWAQIAEFTGTTPGALVTA